MLAALPCFPAFPSALRPRVARFPNPDSSVRVEAAAAPRNHQAGGLPVASGVGGFANQVDPSVPAQGGGVVDAGESSAHGVGAPSEVPSEADAPPSSATTPCASDVWNVVADDDADALISGFDACQCQDEDTARTGDEDIAAMTEEFRLAKMHILAP